MVDQAKTALLPLLSPQSPAIRFLCAETSSAAALSIAAVLTNPPFSPRLPPRGPTRQLHELYIRTPAQLEKSFKCEDTIDDLRHLFRGRLMAAMKHELKLYHAKVVPSRTSAPTSLPPPLFSPPALSPCRWRSSARQLRWLRRSRRRVRSRAASSSYGASCPSCRTSTSSRRPFASASQSAFASREAWDGGR